MANYDRAILVVLGGAANDAAATLDISLQQAQDAAATGAKAIAGKAIATETAGVGFAALNDLWLIHLDISEMDVDQYYTHVRAVITVSAGDTWYIGCVLMREHRVFEPVLRTSVSQLID